MRNSTFSFLEIAMKKNLFLFILTVLIIFCLAKTEVFAANVLDAAYEERFSSLKEQIVKGDYSEAMMALKQIILDDELSAEEKFDLLEKNYDVFKDLGKYTEAGEVLELAYLISPVSEEVLQKVHAELVHFYRTIRKWTKCVDTHFYYLKHVKLKPEEKKAVLFEIIDDYQKNRAFEEASHVLDEIFNMCENEQDFANLYFYHAQSNFNQNNYDKAIDLYKKALAENALDKSRIAACLYQLGFCYEIKHNKKEALHYYEQALPLFSDTWILEKRMEKLKDK